MRIDRGFLGWGVFLILLGAVPLAVRQGAISEGVVRDAWQLWPLILVGIGLGLVLRRTGAEFLGGLVVAGTFGLMLGSVLAVGVGGAIGGCGVGGGQGEAFARQAGTLGPDADVVLAMNCGEFTVRTASGSDWSLEGTSENGAVPDITADSGRLRIEGRQDRSFFVGAPDAWTVTLPTATRSRLSVTLNAGSGTLALDGLPVPSASVTVNAGEVTLDLSQVSEAGSLTASVNAGSLSLLLPSQSMTGSLSANAGSVEMCVPSGVGLRVRTSDSPLGSYNFGDQGLTRSGNTWESPGYASAGARIDLSASANAGSITLNPEGGCR